MSGLETPELRGLGGDQPRSGLCGLDQRRVTFPIVFLDVRERPFDVRAERNLGPRHFWLAGLEVRHMPHGG